jgi:RNA polymerase sigma factor (sigma-70 family)
MSHSPSATIGPDLRAALVAMVRKRVPESEVEDIVQSTLADAIESPHAPEDSESLRRWIFGVAKNKVVDYHRRAGRETFDIPEIAGKPAPHAEADLLRWAEKNLPPGEENKTTLDWMLREGEGEKLEWIAESEKVPAPRVRQRVSRLRRHLKTHWQKEVALLAALGVIATILLLVLKPKDPEPIADDRLPRAAEIRKQAFAECLASQWKPCIEKLDAAKELDPAGDTRPEVKTARENAAKALTLPPPPNVPSPTTTDSDDSMPSPAPTLPVKGKAEKNPKAAPHIPSSGTPAPPTPTPAPPTPAPSWSKSVAPSSTEPTDFSDSKSFSGKSATPPKPAAKSVGKPAPAQETKRKADKPPGKSNGSLDFDSISK